MRAGQNAITGNATQPAETNCGSSEEHRRARPGTAGRVDLRAHCSVGACFPSLCLRCFRDYFQSVGNSGPGLITDPSAAPSANALFVSSFKGAYGLDRVTNDPMEAAYIAVYIWKQAAEQAGVIDVTKLRAAAYGQVFDAPEVRQKTWNGIGPSRSRCSLVSLCSALLFVCAASVVRV